MSILFFLIALGLLIFVHEIGHFLLAKRSDVYVEEFSLGFGPRIFGIKRGETDYRISALPLGGYVKMKGEDESSENADDPRSFAKKSVGKRALIVAFGPFMNFVFAFAVMPIVFMIGRSEPAFLKRPPLVSDIKRESPAAEAGILKGDIIKAINGKSVSNWEGVLNNVIMSAGNKITLTIARNGQLFDRVVEVVEMPHTQQGSIGIEPTLFVGNDTTVDDVSRGGPASRAGIKPKDVIVEVNGKTVEDWVDLSSKINEADGNDIILKIKRDSQYLDVKMKPEYNKTAKRWLIGILKDRQRGIDMTTIRYGFIDSFIYGTKENIRLICLTFAVLKKLITLNISYKVLGGPVIIAKASAAAAASGFSHFLYFLAFLSIQLAIINCLPIPVLDGGHLAFLGIEAIRRKPVSLKIRQTASQIGFLLLIVLMVVITWNDINKVFNVEAWLKKFF